jgi:hypothetical protein
MWDGTTNYTDHVLGLAHQVPAGGTDGQVLAKASNTDYDLEWITASGGGTIVITETATDPTFDSMTAGEMIVSRESGDMFYKSDTGGYVFAGDYTADPVDYTLDISPTPTNGRITEPGDGTHINCGTGGNDCTEDYASGTNVTLNAIADSGYALDSWSGTNLTDNGDGTATVAMTQDINDVTATFSATGNPDEVVDIQVEYATGTNASNVKCAIYTVSDGALQAETEIITLAAGVNTLQLNTPYTLVSGITYGLGCVVESLGVDVVYNSAEGSAARHKDNTAITWPTLNDPLNDPAWSGSNYQYNIVARNSDGTVLIGQMDGTTVKNNVTPNYFEYNQLGY